MSKTFKILNKKAINKYTKKVFNITKSWGKCKLRPQWDTARLPPKLLMLKTTTALDKDVNNNEFLFIVVWNVEWNNPFANSSDSLLYNLGSVGLGRGVKTVKIRDLIYLNI